MLFWVSIGYSSLLKPFEIPFHFNHLYSPCIWPTHTQYIWLYMCYMTIYMHIYVRVYCVICAYYVMCDMRVNISSSDWNKGTRVCLSWNHQGQLEFSKWLPVKSTHLVNTWFNTLGTVKMLNQTDRQAKIEDKGIPVLFVYHVICTIQQIQSLDHCWRPMEDVEVGKSDWACSL